jgi:hypothetical protein
MALVLALALSYGFAQHGVPRGEALLPGLEVSFAGETTSEAADSPGAVDLANSANRYYEDESEPTTKPVAETPKVGGGAGNRHALSELLAEKPSVNLSGVLPAAGGGLGSGALAGEGVGSASGLTAEPRGSNQLRGGSARTAVFGAVGEGHRFVYVFDRSGSMDGHNGAPLNAAKAELLNSLKSLDQVHQFQIIFYNEEPRVFNPSGVAGRLVFGNDQNKYLAQKFVGSITADGATRHEEALVMALRLAPDVIFFLTDADEPRMTARQLAHVVRTNQGTSINAIEFGYGPQTDADNFLVKLARQNGGRHVYVDVSKLPAAR